MSEEQRVEWSIFLLRLVAIFIASAIITEAVVRKFG
jgi:hypothetical protein